MAALVHVAHQNRKNCTVSNGIEKLVAMPRCGERAGLGLAVADHTRDHELGIVKRRAKRVRQRVAELATLVNAARRLGRDVRWNTA